MWWLCKTHEKDSARTCAAYDVHDEDQKSHGYILGGMLLHRPSRRPQDREIDLAGMVS